MNTDDPERGRGNLDGDGFIMVVLLIGMAITAIMMAEALPSWRQQAVRENEAELIFRGEQYARAIHLYQCKNGTYPPSIDLLVSQRYLRKKYTDPIANADFVPLAGLISTGSGQAPQAGITAVRSKSTDTSIKVYNGQQTYSQFAFETTVNAKMGGCNAGGVGTGAGGRGGPNEQNGRGTPPGGRGGPVTPGGRGGGGGRGGPGTPGAGGRGGVGPGAAPGGGLGNGGFGGPVPPGGGR